MPRARKPAGPGQAPDPRGGPRVGNPGKQYPQRSDLRAQPVTVARNQPYGAATQQAAAQRAQPLPQTPPPSVAPQGPAAAAEGGGFVPPGSLGDFLSPTNRPNEPLTTGIPMGAGAGPEVLSSQDAAGANLGMLLESLARQPGASADVAWLAEYLRSGRR
jgi:hypothetical protein